MTTCAKSLIVNAERTLLSVEFAKSVGACEGVLTLVPVGRLINSRWHYDRENDHGSYVYEDVTDLAYRYLFDQVRFADGVKLRDVFELTRRHIGILEPIIGNWCAEIIAEGDKAPKVYTGAYDPEGIEYLELYRHMELNDDEDKGAPELNEWRLCFDGVGFARREESDSSGVTYSIGDRTSWAIEYTPVNELVDIPLRFKRLITIYDDRKAALDEWIKTKDRSKREVGTYTAQLPLLIEVIYGIFWELSFAGPPPDRDAQKKLVMERYDDAMAHPEKCVPIDDVFKALGVDGVDDRSSRSE